MAKLRGQRAINQALGAGRDDQEPVTPLPVGGDVVVTLDAPDYGKGIETLDDGTLIVELDEDELGGDEGTADYASAGNPQDTDNLAEYLDEATKTRLAQRVLEWVDADIRSRSRWMEIFKEGLERCGVLPDVVPNVEDVEGLSEVIDPLLVEAAVQFQARAVAELFPSSGPVKAMLLGESSDELDDLKDRVEQHMNWQMVTEDEEYFDDVDKMLFLLPFAGSCFKKTYYDEDQGIVISRFHGPSDVIVPYNARSLKRTPRLTHRIYYSQTEMEELQDAGVYSQVVLGQPAVEDQTEAEMNLERKADLKEPSDIREDAEHVVYETQCRWKLDCSQQDKECDGRYKDYIVTVERDSRKLLAVRKNWRVDRKGRKTRRQWFAHYKYLPGFGFYGFGLIHAIGGLGEAATDALRELLDAGRFATRQGGFMTEEIRVPRGQLRLRPGVYVRTENTADDLQRAFYTPPFKEPSAALVKMYEIIGQKGERFGSITEAMTGESNQNTPVGTTVARIEQASMVYSAVHKRLHRAAASEFRQRAILNGEWLSKEPEEVSVEGGTLLISAQDYQGPVRISPVSDPNITSTPQRIAMAQSQLQLASQAPGLYDRYEVHMRVLRAMRVPDPYEILQDPDEIPRTDPVTEGALMMIGKPVRAFPEQDHPDHLKIHMGQMASIQGTPMADIVGPIVQAHIAEHFAQMYLIDMSQKLGVALGPLPFKQSDRKDVAPEMDNEIAMAAGAVVSEQMAQMQSAGQQPGGPPPDPNAPTPAEVQAREAKAAAEAQAAGIRVQREQEGLSADQARAQREQALAAQETAHAEVAPQLAQAKVASSAPKAPAPPSADEQHAAANAPAMAALALETEAARRDEARTRSAIAAEELRTARAVADEAEQNAITAKHRAEAEPKIQEHKIKAAEEASKPKPAPAPAKKQSKP